MHDGGGGRVPRTVPAKFQARSFSGGLLQGGESGCAVAESQGEAV